MKNIFYSLCLLLLASLLTACGFALKGPSSVNLAPQLQTLELQSANGASSLYRIAERSLRRSNIVVIESPATEVYRLTIGAEQLTERIISLNSNARAGEFELSMSLPFQLNSSQGELLLSERLSVERIYLADPENAVAKAEEADIIEQEMRQALIDQLLRQLQALNFD